MASRLSADQRSTREVIPAGVISCVLAVLFLAVTLSTPKVSWLRDLRDARPTLYSCSLIVIVLIAFAVAILFGSQWSVRRRALSDPTPAGLWGRANGCGYAFFDQHVDPAVLSAVGIQPRLFRGAFDVVHGRWEGREFWAFLGCEADGVRSARTPAVVLRMRHPSSGRPWVWPPEDAQLRTAMAGLPEVSVFGIWGDDPMLVALKTPWTQDPDQVLPAALALLTRLAAILEADAASPASAEVSGWDNGGRRGR